MVASTSTSFAHSFKQAFQMLLRALVQLIFPCFVLEDSFSLLSLGLSLHGLADSTRSGTPDMPRFTFQSSPPSRSIAIDCVACFLLRSQHDDLAFSGRCLHVFPYLERRACLHRHLLGPCQLLRWSHAFCLMLTLDASMVPQQFCNCVLPDFRHLPKCPIVRKSQPQAEWKCGAPKPIVSMAAAILPDALRSTRNPLVGIYSYASKLTVVGSTRT